MLRIALNIVQSITKLCPQFISPHWLHYSFSKDGSCRCGPFLVRFQRLKPALGCSRQIWMISRIYLASLASLFLFQATYFRILAWFKQPSAAFWVIATGFISMFEHCSWQSHMAFCNRRESCSGVGGNHAWHLQGSLTQVPLSIWNISHGHQDLEVHVLMYGINIWGSHWVWCLMQSVLAF